MPIYVYKAEKSKGCAYCKKGFELLQGLNERALKKCPKCDAPVRKSICAVGFVASKTSLDRSAKEKGFHKLKKVDKGKYEKLY